MANPYYNPGTNHADYTQGHALPQSPFQQPHSAGTGSSTSQHLPVYQQSPYAVHPIPPPPHNAYANPGEPAVLHYHTPLPHTSGHRWVNSLDESSMLGKYRDEPDPAYDMDHHSQPQNHQQQQQSGPSSQQHLHAMQAQQSAESNMQPQPLNTSISSHTEHMSPATHPAAVRTGRRGRPPGSKNKHPSRRKSTPPRKAEEHDDDLEETGPGIKTKFGRKVQAPQQFQPATTTSRKRRPADDTHFCHICSRAGAPGHDALVFCDMCDTPYHQRCHNPPISDATLNSGSKWYCSSCKPPLPPPPPPSMEIDAPPQRMVGQALSVHQKRQSLSSLTRAQLEDLLIQASDMNPGLPLFPIGGDVDQFQVPRIMPGTPTRQLRIAETDLSNQYNHQRLDSHDQPPPQQLPLTPMHGPPASQQSPLEQSPVYGQITDLPHYELMIVKALEAINDPNGSPPKSIWEWMNNNYPCNPKFRASASQALQKALKKGRLLKTGSLYKINPDFNPSHAENPKATRRPQMAKSHHLYNLHSRNNSIVSMSSSPMQTSPHGGHSTPSQHPSHQPMPGTDLPPLGMSSGLPGIGLSRDHHEPPSYLDHNAVFGTYGADPSRPSSSHHDQLPSFPHHPHQM